MIKKYEFETMEQCDDAAGEIYTQLRNRAYRIEVQNLGEVSSHDIHRVYGKHDTSFNSDNEVMRFEFQGTVVPPCLRVVYGTSKDNFLFSKIVEDAVADCKGKEVPDKKPDRELG